MKLKLLRTTASKIVRLFLQDSSSTTGAGLTGLTSASSGLTCYYIREGDASETVVSLSAGTVGTWSSGGFKEVSSANLPGVYELGLPNAALSTGNSTLVMLKGATNLTPTLLEIELDAVNYQSATAFITGVNSLAPPTNWNLDSIDSSGRRLLQPTQTGVTIPTVTSLTNAVTVGTNNDKTGYTASTVSDKTGYSLSVAQTFNLTGNVTGNLSGSVGSVTGAVGSVTGAVGSVTGAVGSVTGNVGGNVAGSVGSVAAAVTAGTVSDKSGYSLTSAEHTAISGTDVPAALTAQGYTMARAPKLDNLDATVSSRSSHSAADVWAVTTRTLTGFGTLAADVATAVWASVSRTLTVIGDSSGVTTLLSRLTAGRATGLDNLDTNVNSRMATFTYTAPANPTDYARNNVAPDWWVSPDNADVATALSDLVSLLARTDPATALTTLQTAATAIRAKTDLLTFTGSAVNAAISGDATTTLYGDAGAIDWTYTVFDVDGTTPLPGTSVQVSADSAGTRRSQAKLTDSLGRVRFSLDAGTVYVFRSRPDRTFSDPDTEVVGL